MKRFLVKGTNKLDRNFVIVVNANSESEARQINLGCDENLIKSINSVEEVLVGIGTQFSAKTKDGGETEWEVTGLTPNGYFLLYPMNHTLDEYKNDFEKLKKNNPLNDFGEFEKFATISVEVEWFKQRTICIISHLYS